MKFTKGTFVWLDVSFFYGVKMKKMRGKTIEKWVGQGKVLLKCFKGK